MIRSLTCKTGARCRAGFSTRCTGMSIAYQLIASARLKLQRVLMNSVRPWVRVRLWGLPTLRASQCSCHVMVMCTAIAGVMRGPWLIKPLCAIYRLGLSTASALYLSLVSVSTCLTSWPLSSNTLKLRSITQYCMAAIRARARTLCGRRSYGPCAVQA